MSYLPPDANVVQYRTIDLEPRALDSSKLTIDLSFSSENPVQRLWGREILDHRTESVRLDRLNNGAPLLLDHRIDNQNHIGTVEKAYLQDGKGRAKVRFGDTPAVREGFSLIQQGIKRAISVGYQVHKAVLESQSDTEGDTFRVIDWEPLEISLVTLPADPSVGVGRSFSIPQQPPQQHSNIRSNSVELSDEKLLKASRQGQFVERSRVDAIQNIASWHPNNKHVQELAKSAIRDGLLVDVFQRNIGPMLTGGPQVPGDQSPPSELGMERREIKRYSILRAVQAMVSHQIEGRSPGKIAPYELECSRQIADQMGKEPRGFYIPYDVQRGSVWTTRATPMDTSDNSHLVATEHLAADFFSALCEKCIVIDAGSTILTGARGNLSIPGFSSGAGFTWLPEDGDSVDTEPGTTAVTLSPKTVSASIPLTRRLLKQSSPDIEQLIRSDLIAGSAEAIDLAALAGTGLSNQPTGIIATTGVNTATISTPGSPSWAEIVDFELQCALDLALSGPIAYVLHPTVVAACKTTSKDSGSGKMLIENGKVNGYRYFSTVHAGSNGIVFGNFADLLISYWGVLDVSADVATKARSGGLVIRAFQDVDIAVRRAVGFCINA